MFRYRTTFSGCYAMAALKDPPLQEPAVAKNKEPGRPSAGRQVNVRLSPQLIAELERIAEATGGDLSSAIRLVLTKHVPEHLAEADQVLERIKETRRKEDKKEE